MKKGKSVFSLIWPIALIIIALYLFLLFKGGKAFDFGRVEYKETTATCESVGHEITRSQIDRSMEGRPNDKDQYYIIYNYSYEVDGITYHASESPGISGLSELPKGYRGIPGMDWHHENGLLSSGRSFGVFVFL